MCRNPLHFFRDLAKQPRWVFVWVNFLMFVNMASLAFWSEPLAKLVFVVFMVSGGWMMLLYSRFGMARILGLGHVFWLALLPYLLLRLPALTGDFRNYVVVLSVTIAISLAFDIVDVYRYVVQRRRETV